MKTRSQVKKQKIMHFLSTMSLTFCFFTIKDTSFRSRCWIHFGGYGREREKSLRVIVVTEHLIGYILKMIGAGGKPYYWRYLFSFLYEPCIGMVANPTVEGIFHFYINLVIFDQCQFEPLLQESKWNNWGRFMSVFEIQL